MIRRIHTSWQFPWLVHGEARAVASACVLSSDSMVSQYSRWQASAARLACATQATALRASLLGFERPLAQFARPFRTAVRF